MQKEKIMNFHGFWRLPENLQDPESVTGEIEINRKVHTIQGKFYDDISKKELPNFRSLPIARFPADPFTIHIRALVTGQLGRDWNSTDPSDFNVDPRSWTLEIDGAELVNDATKKDAPVPPQMTQNVVSLAGENKDTTYKITPEFIDGKVHLHLD